MKNHEVFIGPGQDVKQTIEHYTSRNSIDGYIVGAIGDLESVSIQCPGQSLPTKRSGHFELIALIGKVTPHNVHLHISFSDNTCSVFGGHLEEGAIALKGIHVFIASTNIDPINKDSLFGTSIEIATLENCPWSRRIIKKLQARNISYKEIKVEDDSTFEYYKNQSKSSIFPQIYLDGKYYGGYDQIINKI